MSSSFFIGVYPGIGPGHLDRVGEVLDAFLQQRSEGTLREPTRADLRLASRALSPRRLARPATPDPKSDSDHSEPKVS